MLSKEQVEFFNANGYLVVEDAVTPDQLNALRKDFAGWVEESRQTWNFAHPANKQVTGPLPRFKTMLKGKSYSMMIDHLEHTVTQLAFGDNWAQFEVIILGKDKNYHKFNWQVEKLTSEGPLNDCWLTTMVSQPISLGNSI